MANHKRKRPKSQRNGCLQCKPHKHQAVKNKLASQPTGTRRRLQVGKDERNGDDR